MVGPTWTRVHLTLGSDCLPAIVPGDYLAPFHASLFAHAYLMSNDTGLY